VQLGERIAQDWETRCAAVGAGASPEARIDGLTVRVVNITEKAVEVKPQFKAQFEGCPSHFKFKQKVILLFQTIEGVDVLLFIVFVQARRRLSAPSPAAACRRPVIACQKAAPGNHHGGADERRHNRCAARAVRKSVVHSRYDNASM
jgi:hypothetical protein